MVWLFTLVLAGPLVALLWRTRRRLADATTVQLTRYPGALADALRALAGLDVVIPAAVPVHFLFPVWDPQVERDTTRTDVTSVVLRMQLPPGVAASIGWMAAAVLLLAALLLVSALLGAGVLYAIGWVR